MTKCEILPDRDVFSDMDVSGNSKAIPYRGALRPREGVKPSPTKECCDLSDEDHGENELNDGANSTDDLQSLIEVLPPHIREKVESRQDLSSLLEIVLDLGRNPEVRFDNRMEYLSNEQVTRDDLNYVVSHTGKFSEDNRAGIERTLHRISAIRSRTGSIIGLTCRIGRAVFGTVDIVRDVVEESKSLLLVGPPGVGKTTLLREAARVLADDLGKRVIIVDTSNEIGGDGDIPHPGIGRARRMQVPSPYKAACRHDRGRREPHAGGNSHRRNRHRSRSRRCSNDSRTGRPAHRHRSWQDPGKSSSKSHPDGPCGRHPGRHPLR